MILLVAACCLALASALPFNAEGKPFYNGNIENKPYFDIAVSILFLGAKLLYETRN